MEGELPGSQYNRAWRIHHAKTKALERLLFKSFKNEVERQMSDEVFNIAYQDEDSITEKKYENYKTIVRGITLRLYSCH